MRTVRSLAITLFLLAVFAACGMPREVRAQTSARVALIIANAAYPDADADLPTPINDATALAEELTRRGFSVETAKNLTKDGMQAAVDGFLRRVEPDSVALIFFSGYAIQVARKNYLVPVDARIWSEADVLREGLGVDKLLADLGKRGAAARVMILDASRRNPFERRYRSFSTGLGPVSASPGTLVLYSAAAGSVVNETAATRSLFVAELVKQIALPGISAEQAFRGTRDAMSRASRGAQVPALASGLEEAFSFDPSYVKPAGKPAPPPVVSEAKPPPVAIKPQDPVPPVETKPLPEPKPTPPVAIDTPPPSQTAKPTPPAAAEIAPPKTEPEPAPPAQMADKEPGTPVPDEEQPEARPSRPGPGSATQMASKEPDAPLAAEEQTVADFNDANAIGTKQAYEDFLARHPTGSLAARARAEIARIEAASREAASTPTEPAAPPAASYSPAERQRKAALDDRIARNPRDEGAFYERGQFHAQRGDTALAIADFNQSIRMNSKNPEAYNNRCWTRAVANELALALADCDQALKLRPNFVDALDSRGFVNLKAGRFRAAIADYDAALKLDLTHSSSLYGRGIARRRLGQTAQAERDFATALQLNATIDKEFAGYGLR